MIINYKNPKKVVTYWYLFLEIQRKRPAFERAYLIVSLKVVPAGFEPAA